MQPKYAQALKSEIARTRKALDVLANLLEDSATDEGDGVASSWPRGERTSGGSSESTTVERAALKGLSSRRQVEHALGDLRQAQAALASARTRVVKALGGVSA